MVSQRLLGLPPITTELKSISPYLQRADELKSQDPVMAYWCSYYAAQVGISIKAKDTASRDLLFGLLGALERMKKDIGPNDAIDIENASSAYVENFALRVFGMADNEDRSGHATRSTAKKFLAAANFLEVLKIFPKSEISESNEEKIRYAKWKAADIAKAFREGRKPSPGPAGSPLDPNTQNQLDLPSPPIAPNDPSTFTHKHHISSSPPRHSPPRSPPRFSTESTRRVSPSGSMKRLSPPPQMDRADIDRANQDFIPRSQGTPPNRAQLDGSRWGGEGEATPGSWSTAATPPGTAQGTPGLGGNPAAYGVGLGTPTKGDASYGFEQGDKKGKRKDNHSRSGSGSSSGSAGSLSSGGTRRKHREHKPRTSGEMVNPIQPSSPISPDQQRQYIYQPNGGNAPALGPSSSPPEDAKKVHFTPSVIGGSISTTSDRSSPTSPAYATAGESDAGYRRAPAVPPPPILDDLVTHPTVPGAGAFIAPLPPHVPSGRPTDPHGYNSGLPPGFIPDRQTSWNASSLYESPTAPAPPPPPPQHKLPPPQPPQIYAPPPPTRSSPPRKPPPPPFELTPSIVAKAQKHCRFAISALDYEDADQAKRELRAALTALGG